MRDMGARGLIEVRIKSDSRVGMLFSLLHTRRFLGSHV